MGFEFLDVMFRGICVGVAASITVGPVAVLCIQRTLSKSRRSGIVSSFVRSFSGNRIQVIPDPIRSDYLSTAPE